MSQILWLNKDPSEGGHDEHLAKFECGGGDAASEVGQVILVAVCGFLEETVFSQALDHAGYLPWTFSGQVFSQFAVAESADVEFAARDDPE